MEVIQNEPNKEIIAELSKKLGLNNNDQPNSNLGNLLNGDLGTSINLSVFIPAFIIFVLTAFLLFFYLRSIKKRNGE